MAKSLGTRLTQCRNESSGGMSHSAVVRLDDSEVVSGYAFAFVHGERSPVSAGTGVGWGADGGCSWSRNHTA
jgi:hypothetical protein